jgi:hypothetical protein
VDCGLSAGTARPFRCRRAIGDPQQQLLVFEYEPFHPDRCVSVDLCLSTSNVRRMAVLRGRLRCKGTGFAPLVSVTL